MEVDTPQGLKTGSSVIEVQTDVASEYAVPTPGRVSTRFRGEAAAVDLPGGKTLFALLRSKDRGDWAGFVLFKLAPQALPTKTEDSFLGTFANMLALKGVITLPRY